jgi:hypothetical protein
MYLEVPAGHSDIILLLGMVELGQTPINQPKLSLGRIDHDVVRLHVAMHDAIAVRIVQGAKQLVEIVADVRVR